MNGLTILDCLHGSKLVQTLLAGMVTSDVLATWFAQRSTRGKRWHPDCPVFPVLGKLKALGTTHVGYY